MGVEIERKFLVIDDSWKAAVVSSHSIAQGYLSRDPDRTVRIRRQDDQAFITIKGAPAPAKPGDAPSVPEFEYAIPADDADRLLALCLPGTILKTRHRVAHAGHTWEIDVFDGDNAGLIVAEIELRAADEAFVPPPWLGLEVTHDRRYANAALAQKPYGNWDKPPVTKPPEP